LKKMMIFDLTWDDRICENKTKNKKHALIFCLVFGVFSFTPPPVLNPNIPLWPSPFSLKKKKNTSATTSK
jgi:hypothetical protein